jgi:hypothetical protein
VPDRATAIHEAAHATAAVHFGRELLAVSLNQHPGRIGQAYFVPPEPTEPGSEEELRLLTDRGVIAWAGPTAERRFIGAKDDVETLPGARLDLDIVEAAARLVAANDDARAQRCKALWRLRAQVLVWRDDFWAAVEAVADELLAETLLTDPHVRRIVEAHYVPR